jgi:SAM-dependent methyltransferase
VNSRIGSEPQYDVFADEFLDHARDGFYNAHYDRPTCLGLLGDVAGRRLLDAACGPGLYAEALAARGAEVVGFDQSPRMVELCRERVPSGTFRVHDLGEPLDWLPDASCDLHCSRWQLSTSTTGWPRCPSCGASSVPTAPWCCLVSIPVPTG